ncbi:MAG: alkaline phosphatase family protein [Caulobacter sp.]|nr:alkaline phosphatase family protein [Caulobacter sp.]
MRFRITIGLVAAFLLSACAAFQPTQPGVQPPPLTILISIDGFRPDYMTPADTPVMARLASQGALAPRGMRPSYPSITFPNHYTLVTGQRPDRNGIVSNTMEDPAIPDVTFSMGNHEAVVDRRWWDEAEPLWVTAEQQGRKTATMFWPGSEADIHGVRPTHYAAFNQSMSSAERVDVLLGWIDDPAGPPAFATLYFDIVDTAGHRYGPGSDEVKASAAEVDAAIGRLLDGLKARGLEGKVNLVIVADHGMAAVPPDHTIVADAEDPGAVRMVTGGASGGFALIPGQEARGEALLLKPHDHMTCWRKEDVPERLHYGHNPRVPAIVCMAQVGWYISNADMAGRRKPSTRTTGAHGYDNRAPEMAALFLAVGPSVKAGARVQDMDNVDVYPLLAAMIGVKGKPGDGKLPPGVLK